MLHFIAESVLTWRRRWQAAGSERRRRKRAVDAAIMAFETTTGQVAVRSMSRFIDADEQRCIVLVCWGQYTPPRREFYAVRADGRVEPLTIEQARPYCPGPWR